MNYDDLDNPSTGVPGSYCEACDVEFSDSIKRCPLCRQSEYIKGN